MQEKGSRRKEAFLQNILKLEIFESGHLENFAKSTPPLKFTQYKNSIKFFYIPISWIVQIRSKICFSCKHLTKFFINSFKIFHFVRPPAKFYQVLDRKFLFSKSVSEFSQVQNSSKISLILKFSKFNHSENFSSFNLFQNFVEFKPLISELFF